MQLHAQYDEAQDEYISHRVAQAYEMSQFIKLTSTDCDVVIVAGDLNLQPKDLGYKIITSNASLQDAWITQVDFNIYYTVCCSDLESIITMDVEARILSDQ